VAKTKLQRDLLIPASWGNRRFPWLLIFREGGEGRPPVFFLTHGRNFSKFADRESEGFRIQGHVKEKGDAVQICSELNAELKGGHDKKKPGYQIITTKNEEALNSGKLWLPPARRKDIQ
jgi:hypothetical protein